MDVIHSADKAIQYKWVNNIGKSEMQLIGGIPLYIKHQSIVQTCMKRKQCPLLVKPHISKYSFYL